jgi:hypothetical protein
VSLVEAELSTLPERLSSPPVFSGVRVTRYLVLCVCFVDRCLSFCTFSFGHCVVCSSIYGFWFPIWYLQILLSVVWFYLIYGGKYLATIVVCGCEEMDFYTADTGKNNFSFIYVFVLLLILYIRIAPLLNNVVFYLFVNPIVIVGSLLYLKVSLYLKLADC